MNYLQMYINLGAILGSLSAVFLLVWLISFEGKTKRITKVSLGIAAVTLVSLTIFCAAMVGLYVA